MIEVIVVLVLLAVMASIAVSRTGNIANDAARAGVAEKIRAHLTYVRSKAIGDQLNRYYIAFSGSTYSTKRINQASGGGETDVLLPGETSATVALDAGITTSTINIGFDDNGYTLFGTGAGLSPISDMMPLTLIGYRFTFTIIVNQFGYVM